MSVSATASHAGWPVFLITHEFYPKRGGIATFTEEIARASASLGYDVEVWAQSAPTADEKRDWPFRLKRLPLKGTHDLTCQIQLARELIRHRRDLRRATVYLPEPGPMMTMMLLQFFHAFRPRRLVLTFHGSEILKFARSPLRRGLARQLIRHATRVSTLSTYTQELLLSHFPEAAEKIYLTPGALRSDFAVVPPKPDTRKNKIVVLTVGRLHPRKGQLLTLQALQMLPAGIRSRLEYWVVGGQSKGNYENTLRATAAAQPDLAVRFFGNLPDEELMGVYDGADIFAMTSVDLDHSIEGFGLVYLEAAAHGLPVVAHDVGGVSEAMKDGVTGLLVPPNRPVQLAAAFEKLIHDPALRQRLGAAGREWAMRNCWKESAEALFNPQWASPMIQSRAQVVVRYAETDMMGVVYHGNYLPWFEVGRTTLLKELGLAYKQLEADGYRLPVLEVSARYFRPALYDDTITIVTTLREKPLLRIRLEYEVQRGDERLATGFTVHAFIDREGKPVRPPASAVAVFGKAFQAGGAA